MNNDDIHIQVIVDQPTEKNIKRDYQMGKKERVEKVITTLGKLLSIYIIYDSGK